MEPGDLVLVASHDCDVLNRSLANEPWVELIHAVLEGDALAPDGNYSAAKNPRTLQFGSSVMGSRTVYTVHADARWRAPRALLARADPAGYLESPTATMFGQWLGRRYDRSALPDEFVNRTRDAQRVVEHELKRHRERVTALFVSLSSLAELPPTVDYEVVLVAAMQVQDWNDAAVRSDVQLSMDRIEAALAGCTGIVINYTEVASEASISLDDMRALMRWEYDYLSHSASRGRMAPRP